MKHHMVISSSGTGKYKSPIQESVTRINLFTKDYSVAPTTINHQENVLCTASRAGIQKSRQAILHEQSLLSSHPESLLQIRH